MSPEQLLYEAGWLEDLAMRQPDRESAEKYRRWAEDNRQQAEELRSADARIARRFPEP